MSWCLVLFRNAAGSYLAHIGPLYLDDDTARNWYCDLYCAWEAYSTKYQDPGHPSGMPALYFWRGAWVEQTVDPRIPCFYVGGCS